MLKTKIIFSTVLFGFILLSGTTSLYAQTSDNVTLNVSLTAVQNITVNATQETVTLTFDDAMDYQNGVESDQPAHLTVNSTTNFQVNVKASGALTDGTNTIPVNTITVTPSLSSGETSVGEIFSGKALSTSDQQIINSATSGTLETHYDMNYESSGGTDYINKPAGTYTTTVTYTISPA